MSAGRASSGTRAAEVWRTVNEIVDPCSAAIGAPIGIADMGIVESVDVDGGEVVVRLLPTSPGCLYTGIFDAEIQKRICALGWCTAVDVQLTAGDEIWTEERMSKRGQSLLEARRVAVRSRARARARASNIAEAPT